VERRGRVRAAAGRGVRGDVLQSTSCHLMNCSGSKSI
jgi:hypothetical protein